MEPIRKGGPPTGRLLVIEPDDGPGRHTVAGAGQARAMADAIVDAVRAAARETHANSVNLYLACPDGLAVFWGRVWNRLPSGWILADLNPGYGFSYWIETSSNGGGGAACASRGLAAGGPLDACWCAPDHGGATQDRAFPFGGAGATASRRECDTRESNLRQRVALAPNPATLRHGSDSNHRVNPINPQSAPCSSSPCPGGSFAISPGVRTRWRCVW